MPVVQILKRSDMVRCALCNNAPCDNACPHFHPSDLLRSIWFENEDDAALRLPATLPCLTCSAPCEKACVRMKEVPIKELMIRLKYEVLPNVEGPLPKDEERLKCDFCGIPLENPFLLASSVISSTYEMVAAAFEAGWAGAAFKTLCAFDIHETSPRFAAVEGDNGSFIGFKNIEQLSPHSIKEDLDIFRKLKKNYPNKLILASMMGQNEEEWESIARACQEAGADAIELNFSCPNLEKGGLGSDIGRSPELVERFTRAACRGASIPVLAKLTPNVATMSEAAEAALAGGASGIAAINTIKSVMGVSPYTFVSSPNVHGMSAVGGYSGKAVKPIALRFVEELGKNEKLAGTHISGIGGIETWRDAMEFILLGAGSVQSATAVMQYGVRIIDDLKSGLNNYLYWGHRTLGEVVGLSLSTVSETTDVLERDTVSFPSIDRHKCIGCGRCEISCRDGGHQAIHLNAERRPILDGKKCVGCHLCILVCPQKAITGSSVRVNRILEPKSQEF